MIKFMLIVTLSIISVSGPVDKPVFNYMQTNCDIWDHAPTSSRKSNYDTIKLTVKYVSIESNVYNSFYDKNQVGFYQKLNKKHDLKLIFTFQPINCDSTFYSYPFAYKKKYDYTLFPKEKPTGGFDTWPVGKLVTITCVRYNHYYCCLTPDRLITIITDIVPFSKDSILQVGLKESIYK